MDPSPLVPIQKNVVLVGAGNAHLRFVQMFGMRPKPGVAVTLVSEVPVIPYSAMVPGHLAGDYGWDAISIDLVRLCRTSNVRLVAERATALDVGRREIRFADRPPLRYDVLSLGIGSRPACPPDLATHDSSWLMRPLGRLVERLDALAADLRRRPRPCRFVVVGGGASGCELALAIRRRLADVADFRLTLLQGHDRLLPQFPEKAGRLFADLFRARGITARTGARVTGGDAQALEINGDERLPYDVVLWATTAAPLGLVQTSGLPLTADGFLQVRATLQSAGDPAVFGTGDCIAIDAHPGLARNGVYAVREGMVLFENVTRFLHERPLTAFRPQRRCLCLMNTADGEAALCYGPFVWKGRLARRLKDRIDRRWVEGFTRPAAMAVPAPEAEAAVQMRCGGCGSKISSDVLAAVLRRIDVGDDPRLLMGTRAGEDAAVHRMRPELFGADPERLVEVQTVDFFKAFVDDPYLFGRIAAVHAVSDLHAMHARPFTALAIATLPYARGPVQEGLLYELLSGAVASLRAMGVTLAGGHTVEGPDLALGFAVTGYAEEDALFQKGLLRPGDLLILTKPVGSGALLAAWMRGQLPAAQFRALMDGLLTGNGPAGEVLARHGVRACTDVTGFGLAGHLLEMLDASRVSARVEAGRVPLYDGFGAVVGRGIVSTLHRDNAKAACRVIGAAPSPAWLFDPQTAGGLLAGVRPEAAEAVLADLHAAGYAAAAVIGAAVACGAEPPFVEVA
jgi:selenide,water dikinase